MKKALITFLLIVIVLFIYSSQVKSPTQNEELITQKTQESDEVHLHAGFQVYQNDQLVDFNKFKYMSLEPCSEDEEEHEEDDQHEKAHLHNNIGDVVHVHRPNALWKDLFINLKYPLESVSAAYLNGKIQEDFLNQPIGPYDSLIVFEGENTDLDNKVSNSVTKDHIIETENTPESCGK